MYIPKSLNLNWSTTLYQRPQGEPLGYHFSFNTWDYITVLFYRGRKLRWWHLSKTKLADNRNISEDTSARVTAPTSPLRHWGHVLVESAVMWLQLAPNSKLQYASGSNDPTSSYVVFVSVFNLIYERNKKQITAYVNIYPFLWVILIM